MGNLTYYIVDVFAEKKYAGNQLAVVRDARADPIHIRVEQGYEIGRPSMLYLWAEKVEDETSVFVGRKVQMVARGELP